MLPPGYATRLASQVVSIVQDAEMRMLRRLARELRAGIADPEWSSRKIAEFQAVRQQLGGDMSEMLERLDSETRGVVMDAFDQGAWGAVQEMRAAGLSAMPAARMDALTILAGDIAGMARGVAPLILRRLEDAYRDVVSTELGATLTGVSSRLETAQSVLDGFTARGIGGFVDRSGRSWYLPSYVEMAVRTGVGQAATEGHLATLTRNGHDLVRVIPGPFPCPDCDRWVGHVLSTSGDTRPTEDGRPVTPLDTARAAGHLFGPNCRCATGIYLAGHTALPTDRPEPDRYVADQEQRGLERKIREWKRREAVGLTESARARATEKVTEWESAMDEHLASHPYLAHKPDREVAFGAI